MEKVTYQLNGIYDERTIKAAKELGVNRFGFDFRPRSLNFIQQHLFLDLSKSFLGSEKIILEFENEKDFIIKKIVDDFKASFENEIVLSFNCDQDIEYYRSLECPFMIVFRPWFKAVDFYKIKNFRGFIFDEVFLRELYSANKIETFSANFHGHWYEAQRKNNYELIFHTSWDSDFEESILLYFDIDVHVVRIDTQVETCFRNVNLSILKNWFQLTNSTNSL